MAQSYFENSKRCITRNQWIHHEHFLDLVTFERWKGKDTAGEGNRQGKNRTNWVSCDDFMFLWVQRSFVVDARILIDSSSAKIEEIKEETEGSSTGVKKSGKGSSKRK
jgi:hypothetical protein